MRLTFPAVYTITLTLDDGINTQVTESIEIEVAASAPVLVLNSPNLEQGYYSSEVIEFDLRDSVDYDGDLFTFNLSSDISRGLITDSNPLELHQLQLEVGEHELTFTLVDDTGLSRDEVVNLLVVESDPEVVIYELPNNQFYQQES